MPLFGREPVQTIKGLIGALAVILIAFGVPIDQPAFEASLQGAVVAVVALIAALKVASPDRPTVVAGGLVGGLLVGLESFGLNISEELKVAVMAITVNLVAFVTRNRVTPVVPAAVPLP
jgi:hypothetical protein